MGMGTGVTKNGMAMDQGWNGNGDNDMAHCSHLHQPRAIRTDGENRTYVSSYLNN